MNRYDNILDSFEVYFTKVLSDIGKERSLSFEDVERLKKSPAFRLVVLAPFICDCDYAEMFAYANTSTLITAGKHPEVFNPTKDISIETRATLIIENLRNYAKDKKVYKCCQQALILISIADHKKDLDDDKRINKFNPLFDESIRKKYETLSSKLCKELSRCKKLTDLISIEFILSDGFWN